MGAVLSPYQGQSVPAGAAGGDLSGLYPNPAVAGAHFSGANAGAQVVQAKVHGDIDPRFTMNAAGLMTWGSGSFGGDTDLYRGGASILSTDSSFAVETAGAGLRVKEGANSKQGTAVLVAGTVTVPNTSVTSNSRIFLTTQVPGGVPGYLTVSATVAGVSFTITGISTDTSTVAYLIMEPS